MKSRDDRYRDTFAKSAAGKARRALRKAKQANRWSNAETALTARHDATNRNQNGKGSQI